MYLGRDPVTKAPRQLSRVVHAGRPTAKGEPPRAVKAAAAALEAEGHKGKLGGTNSEVATLLDRHFEALERKGHSPQTLHAYRRYAKLHIIPAIGARPVRKLTAWDLDNLYAAMTDAGKSPATVRQVHAILSGALGQAVKWGWCSANVAKMASPPVVRQARIVAPTAGEVQRLLQAAEDRDPVLSALVMLAALTGARRGELCALRWTDVDLATGTVTIARSIIDLPDRVEEKSTKTHAERTISLGAPGVEMLALHRAQIDARARAGEVDIPADAFIFSERLDCTTPIRPDRVTHFFARVRDDLGLKHVHLHSLRHFVATQLAAAGTVSVRTLAGRLGHADASVTMRVYAAFMPTADADAAEHVGRLLKA